MDRLDKTVSIVTGAASGIGRSIAFDLASAGSTVVVADILEKPMEGGKSTVEEILEQGNKAAFMKTDVTKIRDIKKTVNETIKKFGRIDFLVNDAGVVLYKPLTESSDKAINQVLDVNLKGLILFCREVIPQMEKQGNGVIINIASMSGKKGFKNFTIYCASKFGVFGVTESLAEELENKGINVYSVCPAGVDTKMYHEVFDIPWIDKKFQTRYSKLLKPRDISKKVLELCLPNYKFKTGTIVEVE